MADGEQYDLFCTHCGQRITKDTVYCPECGSQVAAMTEGPRYSAPQMRRTADLESTLKTISIVMAVTAVILLIWGIYDLITVDAQIADLKNSPYWDWMVDLYKELGYTESETEEVIRMSTISSAIVYVLSGISLGIASVCGFKRKMWTLGFVCCIIATFLTCTSIIGAIVGIIVTIQYHKTKPLFT